jgi:hypothetical protein
MDHLNHNNSEQQAAEQCQQRSRHVAASSPTELNGSSKRSRRPALALPIDVLRLTG